MSRIIILLLPFFFYLAMLPAWLQIAALAYLAVAGALTGFGRKPTERSGTRFLYCLLGFLLPNVGWIGEQSLLCLTYATLAVSPPPREEATCWSLPFLFPIAIAAVVGTICAFDLDAVALVVQGSQGNALDSLQALRDWLQLAPPSYLPPLKSFLNYLALVLMYASFRSVESRRDEFARGVLFGMLPCVLLLVFQIYSGTPTLNAAQESYWEAQGRYAAGFSDPNAFGLMAFLILPLFFLWRNEHGSKISRTAILAATVWLLLGTFSGSRSFIVGLLILAGCGLYRLFPRSLKFGFIGVGLVVVTANLADVFLPRLFEQFYVVLPVALQRSIATVLLRHISEAAFSRLAFARIALQIWFDHPVLGIGFSNFRAAVLPYSRSLHFDMGLWADNPNNFYLGVLAETGLVGLLGLVLSVMHLRWKNDSPIQLGMVKAVIGTLMFLFLLGPHLDFAEVAIVTALLMSYAVEPVTLRFPRFVSLCAAPLLVFAISMQIYFSGRGSYLWEQQGGRYFRWTERSAVVQVPCNADARGRINLKVLNPDVGSHPVTLLVGPLGSELRSEQLSSSEQYTLEVDCPKAQSAPSAFHEVSYVVRSTRPWIPARSGLGDDHRVLGVQIFAD